METYHGVKKRGITLVEVVISLLLLGIVIGALIGAFLIGRVSAARAKHRIVAVNLAREKLEIIKGLPYAQIPLQSGTESMVIDNGSASPGDELTGSRATTISDVYANGKLYKITTTVSWTEQSAPFEERAILLISQH